MRYLIFSAFAMLLFAASAQAQTTKFKVVDGGASLSDKGIEQPNSKAALDVSSDTRGVLFPRLTNAQRDAIADPPEGLVIYNLESHCLEVFNGTQWLCAFATPIGNYLLTENRQIIAPELGFGFLLEDAN